ncbi:MAG: site-specific DNA-methyltransferase [Selenomonadaceae bacterium]|nr:site-specific DNA-methyltransferase [Selenomonadaceae bacterium]
MSALDDLIKLVQDDDLRGRLKEEFDKLRKRKKFGLVFENKEEYATLPNRVVRLGDPIYPTLTKLDEVCNAPDSDLWHLLIEAENYHALQLLKYLYAGKVDCIYIDPPYNTGARDWKYNDNYVDAADNFRHSKWLSMMERRLKLAKELLSDSGAIFISIDDNEQATLKLLCNDIFGVKNFVAKFCVKRSGGRQDSKFFAVVNEYLICYAKDTSHFTAGEEIKIVDNYPKHDAERGRNYKTQLLRKWGANSRREDRPNLFYPIPAPDGSELYPMLSTNVEGRWRWGKDKMQEAFAEGRVEFVQGKTAVEGCWRWGKDKMRRALTDGLIEFVQRDGEWIAYEKIYEPLDGEARTKKFTTWLDENFSDGAELVKNIFADNVFAYPKALSLIKKILQLATNKPDALILDFFAGSGTTLHAVNLLNAQDGGKRRCILVTNNEVSDAEAKTLRKQGLTPADDAWQNFGIARYVTWQRTRCSIEGHDINGEPLKGNYLGSELPMADGFKANAIFFKLDYLDKNSIALGEPFKELLPVLWLKAGGIGKCPTLDAEEMTPFKIFAENKFAVLFSEKYLKAFAENLRGAEIDTVFIATSSKTALNKMREILNVPKSFRLYGDYLKHFRSKEIKR